MQPVNAVNILVSNLMVLRSLSSRVVYCNVTNYKRKAYLLAQETHPITEPDSSNMYKKLQLIHFLQ
jgi:hypothetical protein